MKKIFYLILLLVLTINLMGCSPTSDSEQEVTTNVELVEQNEQTENESTENESTESEPVESETAKNESKDSESDASKLEEKEEKTRVEDATEEAVTEADVEEIVVEETVIEETATEETATEETATEETVVEETIAEEVVTEEIATETEVTTEEASTGTNTNEQTNTASTNNNEINLNNGSVTITESGTYYVSGSLDDGQIIIDTVDEEDVILILNNVYLNCNDSAPIYVINSGDVIITAEGDSNTLSIGGDISDNVDGVDGVIFSKSDLVFNGSGTLTIESNYTHGIVGKDDIDFTGGNYNITVAGDGIQANDSISAVNANIAIVSAKDGMQVDNDENIDKGFVYLENSSITLVTGEDAINASNYVNIVSGSYNINASEDGITADVYVQILDGTFNIITGGGFSQVLNVITVGEGSSGVVSETDKLTESMKAIKSNDIIVEGGDFVISSYEDGLNANNNITINGGVMTINSGDEALTAHNILEINDGTLIIENGYEGLEGGYVTINGGDIYINVLDDGINGGESYSIVTITGGTLEVVCQGDGLDSNGDMVISGGYIILDVSAIYVGGDGDVDVTGTLTYTGGTIVDENGITIDPTATMGGHMPTGGRRH